MKDERLEGKMLIVYCLCSERFHNAAMEWCQTRMFLSNQEQVSVWVESFLETSIFAHGCDAETHEKNSRLASSDAASIERQSTPPPNYATNDHQPLRNTLFKGARMLPTRATSNSFLCNAFSLRCSLDCAKSASEHAAKFNFLRKCFILPKFLNKIKVGEDQIVYQFEKLPRYSLIDGEIYPAPASNSGFKGFSAKTIRSAQNLKVRNDDIFVITYPKSGTTWTQHIIMQLVKGSEAELLFAESPRLEFIGAEKIDQSVASPRILKSHLPANLLPNLSFAKVIVCFRNPKDVLVSFYNHCKNVKYYQSPNLSFEAYFDNFIAGYGDCGDYFTHLKSYLPYYENSNYLFLLYEEMLSDLPSAVKKIAAFLGGFAAQQVHDDNRLMEIVQNSTFANMQKSVDKIVPRGFFLNSSEHFRKGVSKDWRNWFTKEQSDALDKKFVECLKGTIAENWWKHEMQWED